eukprot:2033720-Lingulodinium_polyedra.AAC.1
MFRRGSHLCPGSCHPARAPLRRFPPRSARRRRRKPGAQRSSGRGGVRPPGKAGARWPRCCACSATFLPPRTRPSQGGCPPP